jgi:hypothetical protein
MEHEGLVESKPGTGRWFGSMEFEEEMVVAFGMHDGDVGAFGNPLDDLMALQRHAAAGPKAPESWLPWNYHQAIAAVGCG